MWIPLTTNPTIKVSEPLRNNLLHFLIRLCLLLFPKDELEKITLESLQLAKYAPGSETGYKKHKDTSEIVPNHRILTLIFYLVDDWTSECGGCLRLWPEHGECITIAPKLNRLLIFPSHLMHQVLPIAEKNRFAFTLWVRYPQSALPPPNPEVVDDRESRIFVSIPCYRDRDLVNTIKSLLSSALFPHRLIIGVHLQLDEEELGESGQVKDIQDWLPSCANIRFIITKASDSQGPQWSRAMIQAQLYDQEEFYLQLDSHVRFRLGWDMDLLQDWRSNSSSSNDKLVISTYPPDFPSSEGPLTRHIEEKALEAPASILYAAGFDQDGMLLLKGRPSENGAKEQNFVAAGFLFASRRFVEEIPADPSLKGLFFGEECLLSARLYTHGFRIRAPRRNICVHRWKRNSPLWNWNVDKRRDAQLLVKQILAGMTKPESAGGDGRHGLGDKWGLGVVRSIKEFETNIGVKFPRPGSTE